MPKLRRWAALASGFLTLASAPLTTTAAVAAAPAGFVTASGGQFMLSGAPYRYGGTNNYYLSYQSHDDVDDVLTKAQEMNLSVIRTWGFIDVGSLDGSTPNVDGNKNGFYFQYWDPATGAPAYNDGATGLEGLDYAIADAQAHGLRVIIALTNDWKDFGGMDQYDTWYGLKYHDQFYTDPRTQQAYKNWAAHLINHVNTVTGVAYKDDPTIFSWELANEPRCVGSGGLPTSGICTQDTITNWVDEMSTYVKSLDPNHMVDVGDEGFYIGSTQGSGWPYNDPSDGVDNTALLRVANIDFGTFHLYPDYWGGTADWGTQWVKDHIANAAAIGKPTILEEFGFKDTSTRDSVYQTWTSTVRGNGGAGWNFWMLAGDVNGSPYPNYDGFNVYYPSSTATVLANEAIAISGATSGGDSTPPTEPTDLTVSSTTSGSVSLSWTAASDNVGVAGYDVLRNGALVGTTTGTTTSFTDTGLLAATAYSYAVKAFDAAGNVSSASAAVTATTTASSGGGGGGGTPGAVTIQYKNNDSAPGDNQIKPGLRIVNNTSSALDLSALTVRYYFTHDGGAASYTYSCDYAAIGCGKVYGTFVAMANPTATADTYLQLSFTGSLAAGASSGDLQNRINKTDWSNFDETNDYSHNTNTSYVDASAVTAYLNGTLVTGVEPDSSSGGGTGGGADTTPPSTPTGLTVSGTTSSSVSLSWAASTDDTAVANYQVFRGSTLVGSPTTTSFSDTGLSASTVYSYTVKAVDAAGNTSDASTAVTATTAASAGGGGGGCTASFHNDNDWGSGFTATITVTNTGTAATNGWTVMWSWGGNQQITNYWNATVTTSGTSVTATNLGYNNAIAAGGNTTFGIQVAYTATNAAPTLTCTTG